MHQVEYDLISKALKSSEGGYEDAQDIWDQISYKIFNPLKHILGNKEILYISPDSEINKISFSTLRSPKNNKKFITEDYKIRLLTTGRDLLNLKKEKNSINNSFVFANPDFEKNISLSSKNNIKEMNSISKRSYNLESFNWLNLPGT